MRGGRPPLRRIIKQTTERDRIQEALPGIALVGSLPQVRLLRLQQGSSTHHRTDHLAKSSAWPGERAVGPAPIRPVDASVRFLVDEDRVNLLALLGEVGVEATLLRRRSRFHVL